MRKDQLSINIPKRWLRRAVIALAVGMLVLPAAAWAGHQFTDVPNSNIFHDDIEWMSDEGVTRGCNPNDNPPNTEYCPDEDITREQMAAFLHRMDTENVFATPDEVDAAIDGQSHFAVIEGDDGSVIASNGLESTERTATGAYTLDFGTDISDCSWTGAVGDRDGTPVANHVVTLNNDATDTGVIHAMVSDSSATDDVADADFNVTVNC